MQKLNTEAKLVEEVVNEIVDKETKFIDEYVDNIRKELDKEDLSVSELNRILIKLCSFSYYLASRQELVGIKQDIALAIEREKYNNHFINQVGTIAMKQSKSEEETKEEAVISMIYTKCYKILKNKYDSINRFSDSVKKIVTAKVKELELTARGNV